jgi:group I intron endonuclease
MFLNSGIYRIENLANRKIYIGSSVDVHKRWDQHRSLLKSGKHGNNYLQHAWNKYGEEAFVFDVLEYTDPTRLVAREDVWIGCTRSLITESGYNIRLAYNSRLGSSSSEETRAKISVALKGRKKAPFSEEHKAKLRAAKVGVKQSPEAIAKRTAALTGLKRSPEVCAAIGARTKGRKLSPEHKAKLIASKVGREVSAETRAKLSATSKGRVHSPESIERAKTSRLGYKPTEETLVKMRAAAQKRVHGSMSEQAKANMSKARKGIKTGPRSPESIAKFIATRTGYKQSEETKDKISATRKERYGNNGLPYKENKAEFEKARWFYRSSVAKGTLQKPTVCLNCGSDKSVRRYFFSVERKHWEHVIGLCGSCTVKMSYGEVFPIVVETIRKFNEGL